jgi:hypothetical protein
MNEMMFDKYIMIAILFLLMGGIYSNEGVRLI